MGNNKFQFQSEELSLVMLVFQIQPPSVFSITHVKITNLQNRVIFMAFSQKKSPSAACQNPQTLRDRKARHVSLTLCANSLGHFAMKAQFAEINKATGKILVKYK